MLIGNGLFFKLLKTGQYRLAEHLPELRETRLGWMLTGEYEEICNQGPSYSLTVTVEDVYDAVQRFWHIEEVPEHKALNLPKQKNVRSISAPPTSAPRKNILWCSSP